MIDLKWSRSEKAIARQVFDRALEREFASFIREAKQRASRIQKREDLWDLENWLTDRREDIGQVYDYRYSVLPVAPAQLLNRGTLLEEDLADLGQEKIHVVRRAAAVWASASPQAQYRYGRYS
jgi:Photoprotection regulator fluorescence recovery protein